MKLRWTGRPLPADVPIVRHRPGFRWSRCDLGRGTPGRRRMRALCAGLALSRAVVVSDAQRERVVAQIPKRRRDGENCHVVPKGALVLAIAIAVAATVSGQLFRRTWTQMANYTMPPVRPPSSPVSNPRIPFSTSTRPATLPSNAETEHTRSPSGVPCSPATLRPTGSSAT
jgi:hypothetical protein